MDEQIEIRDRVLFVKSVIMIFAVAVAFIFHDALELKTSVIALSCAALMILIGKQDVEETVHDVEWPTILFFVFLFIVVGGLEKVGLIHMLAEELMGVTGNHYVILIIAILWVSVICSAILDNNSICCYFNTVNIANGGGGPGRMAFMVGDFQWCLFWQKRNNNRSIGKCSPYWHFQLKRLSNYIHRFPEDRRNDDDNVGNSGYRLSAFALWQLL